MPKMIIILLKRCCSHGYRTALQLKKYLDSKGHTTLIHGKKAFRFKDELAKQGKSFNDSDSNQQAIYIVRELGICMYESEVLEYIKG